MSPDPHPTASLDYPNLTAMARPAAPTHSGPAVKAGTFEGMFKRALNPTGLFLSDLISVGYDPNALKPSYPVAVWLKSLDVARRHVYPDMPSDVAFVRLGRLFFDGFRTTLAGKVVGRIVSFSSPNSMMRRFPRLYTAGRPVSMRTTSLTARSWRLDMDDPYSYPHFVSGIVEGALALTNTEGRATLIQIKEQGFALLVQW